MALCFALTNPSIQARLTIGGATMKQGILSKEDLLKVSDIICDASYEVSKDEYPFVSGSCKSSASSHCSCRTNASSNSNPNSTNETKIETS
mgnify:CR=1 FL=1